MLAATITGNPYAPDDGNNHVVNNVDFSLGYLSTKGGEISVFVNATQDTWDDYAINLGGPYGLLYRSVVLYNSTDHPVACCNIGFGDDPLNDLEFVFMFPTTFLPKGPK